jgi:excisionase family DNA binding protein
MRASDPSTRPALLLTPKQAAEALAISPRKLWGMTASREIPHVRLGRSVRYVPSDLQNYIDAQRQGGN